MIKLRIGGVPEHFSWPWQRAIAARRFEALGIELEWRDYPGGSGAMATALRKNDLDAAVLLTEGAVAAIADGAPFRIASLYTESPLVWGIHVPAASRFRSEAELRGARYAISRVGSGSHLMAFVHAGTKDWPVEKLVFVVVNNLAGAIEAFAAGSADVFFWEKFMTKPLVDAGRFRRVGEFTAPWPAFVVCVADSVAGEGRAAIMRAVSLVLADARTLGSDSGTAAAIGRHYGLAADDVADWLSATRWSSGVGITAVDLSPACKALGSLGVLPRAVSPAECIASD